MGVEYRWRCKYATYAAALGLSTLAESQAPEGDVDIDAPPGNGDIPSPAEHLLLCVQLADQVSSRWPDCTRRIAARAENSIHNRGGIIIGVDRDDRTLLRQAAFHGGRDVAEMRRPGRVGRPLP